MGDMMKRECRTVSVGGVLLGGQNPVAVQSMLNVPVTDIEGNVQQALRLEKAGCQLGNGAAPGGRCGRLGTEKSGFHAGGGGYSF